MGDWLPITGQSFSRALNSTGTGTCALNSTGNALTDSVNVAAVLARKAVLWVLQDGAVVWNGLVLDWQHQSILDGTLPLNCADLSFVLGKPDHQHHAHLHQRGHLRRRAEPRRLRPRQEPRTGSSRTSRSPAG